MGEGESGESEGSDALARAGPGREIDAAPVEDRSFGKQGAEGDHPKDGEAAARTGKVRFGRPRHAKAQG